MKIRKLAGLVFLCAVMTIQSLPCSAAGAENTTYEYYDSITNIVSNIYIDPSYSKTDIVNKGLEAAMKEDPELAMRLLKASLGSLDIYSEMFTAKEMNEYLTALNKTMYGIGVVITTKEDYVVIDKCVDGGSAQDAGIMPGDKIVKIDGIDVTGMTTSRVRTYILGEEGTNVTVTVLRGEKEYTYTLQRCEIHDKTVSFSVLKGDIGYIKVDSFSENTATEFAESLDAMLDEGISKVILDLRNNPGGYTSAAINMAALVVPKGVIISTEFRNEEENTVYESELDEKLFDFCVLVNENTASSAEILASAMQESGAAVLVGEKTYGKGVIQNMFSLPGGMGMKITTGKYITRNGNEINDVGIEPDHEVTNETQRFDTSALTPMDYQTKWSVGDRGEGVVGAKERLSLLGYNVDVTDDVLSAAEADEVTRFQTEHGLYGYGVIDITTQTSLENEVYHLDQQIDNQFRYAYKYFGGIVENDE